MNDIELRRFEPPDSGPVIELWERCDLTRPWNDPRRDIDRKAAHADGIFLVAVRAGHVIGTVMAGYDGHRGWINYLAVDPDERGAHVASTLMAAAERSLADLGCAKINLQIRRTNLDARLFYERLGYIEDDVISMGKRLVDDETERPRR